MAEKILVVEDEPALQETLSYNLTRQGYQLTIAADGQAALTLAREGRPDLIVLDVMLPLLDGFEVCRVLRQEMLVPILMLSARDEEIDRVIDAVPPIIAQLRKLSPYWNESGPVAAEKGFAPAYA